VGGDDGHVVFEQEFSGEKESATVRCRDVTASSLSPKFGAKSWYIFTQ
jgi:hypothetical protein